MCSDKRCASSRTSRIGPFVRRELGWPQGGVAEIAGPLAGEHGQQAATAKLLVETAQKMGPLEVQPKQHPPLEALGLPQQAGGTRWAHG